MALDIKTRCSWVGDNPAMIAYHDTEWGVPCRDDRKLFEYIILDTFQAGLSWAIMIKKREGFRQAFADFDPQKVAQYDEGDIASLVDDVNIVRNRQKITSAVANARAFLEIQKEFGTFANYLWGFVGDRTIQNRYEADDQIPAKTDLAERVSKDLIRRGFKFVGPTIIYAFMQGAGLVNDHLTGCFRYKSLQA